MESITGVDSILDVSSWPRALALALAANLAALFASFLSFFSAALASCSAFFFASSISIIFSTWRSLSRLRVP
jgi:hypothetical protein